MFDDDFELNNSKLFIKEYNCISYIDVSMPINNEDYLQSF